MPFIIEWPIRRVFCPWLNSGTWTSGLLVESRLSSGPRFRPEVLLMDDIEPITHGLPCACIMNGLFT